jgi:hypothetical protein
MASMRVCLIQAVFQDFKHGVPSGREFFQPSQGPNHAATYQLIVVIAVGGINRIYSRAQISVTQRPDGVVWKTDSAQCHR